MISLLNVTKEYLLDEQNSITPVKNVTLRVSRGEFILIIGRSGSGKTTLLNLAAGLIRPTSGQVLVEDANLGEMDDKQLSLLRGRKIGFIFQFPSLLPSLTVLENVVMPTAFGLRDGRQNAYQRATDLLRMVGLAERTGVYPRQLSAGEQKRAVIARALINHPEILLADEPTSDLDVQTEHEIMGLIQKIHAQGVTIMMVTHSPELVGYATRALRMEGGSLSEVPVPAKP